jgi:hypothetical protein
MKIVKQLFKEFWFPLTLSSIWVLYNICGGDSSQKWENVQKNISIFGGSFFLFSWLLSQFFRVQKQIKVDDNFKALDIRFEESLKKFDEIIAHISGGDSFPYFQISMINNETNVGLLMAIHEGEHPLYDVTARIVDLQKFRQIENNLTFDSMSHCDTNVNVGNLISSHATMIQKWQIENDMEQSYNIFFTARNGSFKQFIRLKKIDHKWLSAIKVMDKDRKVLHEQVDLEYPRDLNGVVEWGE